MSINKTCSVPGEQSPLHAKAAFFWPCLGGHMQLHPATPLCTEHRLRRAGGSQDLVLQINKTGDGRGDGGHEEQITNPKSISAASEGVQPRSAVIECAPPGDGFTGSLCPAQCFINIRGNPSFHLFIFVSHFIRPYFQPRSPQWLANQQ